MIIVSIMIIIAMYCLYIYAKRTSIVWFCNAFCQPAVCVGFFLSLFSNEDGDGDPQFWRDIRLAISEEDIGNLLEDFMDANDAPSPKDAARPWPSA